MFSPKSLTNLFSMDQLNSPLHDAIFSNDISYLKQLVTSNSYDIDVTDEFGRTPLIYSIFLGSFVCFEYLLQSGCNSTILDIENKSALHWSCQLGQVKIAKYLLSRDCDVYQKDADGRTVLHHATLHHSPKLLNMILKRMKQSFIDQPDALGLSALHWASYHNNSEACRILIKHHANPLNIDLEGRTSIHLCAGNKNSSTIKVLFELAGQTILTLQDSQGCTLLHHLVAIQNVSLLSTITDPQHSSWLTNFNLNSKDLQHRTPLHWAFALGSSAIAGILLSRGSDWTLLDGNGYLPVHYAIERNLIDCIDCFFSFDFTQDLTDSSDRTCLMLACQLGHNESTRIILERRGTGVNYSSVSSGMSALHYASFGGNIQCLKLLLQYGAEIDQQDNHLRTALSYACEYGFSILVEHLLSYGASTNIPSIDGRLPLHYVVLTSEFSLISLLVSKGNIHTPDHLGRIPLHYACTLDNVVSITLLGFDQINSRDNSGFTPLHWAVMHENIHSIDVLLDHGAKYNLMDSSIQRRTPLDLSLFVQDGEIYSFLRKLGCVTGLEIQTLAVIEIQKFWRGISQKRIRKKHLETEVTVSNDKILLFPDPQTIDINVTHGNTQDHSHNSHFRSCIPPSNSMLLNLQIDEKRRLSLFHKKTEAALVIQLYWRRYLRCKQLSNMRTVERSSKHSDSISDYILHKRELAALLIQLAWRQHLRRKLINSKVVKRRKLFQWSPSCLAIRQQLLIEQLYSQQFQPFHYTPSIILPIDRPSFFKYIPSPAALSFNFAINQYCHNSDGQCSY